MKKIIILLGLLLTISGYCEQIRKEAKIVNSNDSVLITYSGGVWTIESDTFLIGIFDTIYVNDVGYGDLTALITDSALYADTAGYALYGDSVIYADTADYALSGGGEDSLFVSGTNTSIGENSLPIENGANNNTAIGANTLQNNESGGTRNTALGSGAMVTNTSGDHNLALGYFGLGYNTTGSDNIGIGYYAGLYNTTEQYRLYINSYGNRSNILGDSTLSIIYGFQAAATANQRLWLNANVYISDSLVGTKAYFDSIYTTKASAWADFVFGNNYRVHSLSSEIRYAKKHKALKPLHKKTNNLSKRIENTVESVERLYIQVYRNFRITYLLILLLVIWNIVLTFRIRKTLK